MNTDKPPHEISRRQFIGASLAAAALVPSLKVPAAEPHSLLSPKAPMLPAKAKSLILIVTQGGMSQMDTFDPKPELDRHHGKKLTPEILPGIEEVKQIAPNANCTLLIGTDTASPVGSAAWTDLTSENP